MAEFISEWFVPLFIFYAVWAIAIMVLAWDRWQETRSRGSAVVLLIAPVWPLALPILLVYDLYWALRGLAAYVTSLGPLIRTAFDKED